jgi:hypothetical protein
LAGWLELEMRARWEARGEAWDWEGGMALETCGVTLVSCRALPAWLQGEVRELVA